MIIISNEEYSAGGISDLRETEITNKTHNVSWIKGLKIFDGADIITFDNTLQKAQNVPLLFQDQEDDYILIPCIQTLTIAKAIINKIINENGGEDNFSTREAGDWEYLHVCNEFTIGYLTKYTLVRINRHSK